MRYLSKGIKRYLSSDYINILWSFYDEGYQNVPFDDYQFFKIENNEGLTTLKMWQEVPQAIKIKSIPTHEECEIWIINDGNVETMMLSEEY